MGGIGAVLSDELERARVAGATGGRVVLVEGASDKRAVASLATRHDRDLAQDGVVIIAIAGATNIGRFVEMLGPGGFDVHLSGLCDRGEARDFARAIDEAGVGSAFDEASLARLGFFVCHDDLEEELIRALGPDAVMGVMESQGQLRSFQRFQNQPAQREKSIEDQLWRWLGNHKIRYAPLLVDALDLDRVPGPLGSLMARLEPHD